MYSWPCLRTRHFDRLKTNVVFDCLEQSGLNLYLPLSGRWSSQDICRTHSSVRPSLLTYVQSSTYFPFLTTTRKYGRLWLDYDIVPVYATASRCEPPYSQRNAFPAGQLSCYSYCQYTSPLTGECSWKETGKDQGKKCSTTAWSTISTCVSKDVQTM